MTIVDATVDEAPPHRRATRSVRDLPAAERPRERLAMRGPGGLSAAELISVILGTGGAGRSAHGGRRGPRRTARRRACARRAPRTWSSRRPRGSVGAKAARLAAAFELGRRSVAEWPTGRWTIRSPRDVFGPLGADMGRLEREELRVLVLNTKNVVQRVTTVYVGNVSASLVRVGELFRDAVRLDAAGIVLVHNHPSGDPTPSARTTSTSPRRRSLPGGCWTWTCSTTWSSGTTRGSACATAA